VKRGSLRVGLAAVLCALFIKSLGQPASAQVKPEGEMRWALYVTLSSAWFDPGEVVGVITPFLGALCLARCAREADAGQPPGPEFGGILDAEPGPESV